jgi:CRP-like cAMP-binding protein
MDAVLFSLRDNRLLALLDEQELAALAGLLEPVDLTLHSIVQAERTPMEYAYFPVHGVLSVLTSVAPAEQIEVANIGPEGMLGVPILLDAQLSHHTAIVQIAGAAWRMSAAALRSAAAAHPRLSQVIRRYTHALLVLISQAAACNRLHPVEQRCARWLLQTHDRVRGDEFDLTQEFLAQMLGERRAAVNAAASLLQQRGCIRYSRGHISVVDRAALEGAACGCYALVRDEFARMLTPPR